MFASFHIAIGLMWCDVCVKKRDVENETREIIAENKVWCITVMLLIFDQIMLGKNGKKYYRKGKNCIVLYLFAIYHKNVITYMQVC